MAVYRRLAFLFQSITVGLAIAFLLLLWKPEIFDLGTPTVQVLEAPAGARERIGGLSFADAVGVAAPAVVNVNTRKMVQERANPLFDDPVFRHFFGDSLGPAPRRRLETSLGSGVIISAQGYILTNNHVIDGAEEIQVSLRDGRTAAATVVGTDPEADLAVLKVSLPDLPTVVLGRSEDLREGDVVLAIGNPFGVGQTVTQGIVSATGRTQLGISTFENFIQTDAAINPGNSGGALINAAGELVGINTAIFTRTGGSQGIGFAIPVTIARDVMEQIIETGHVSRGWLGIEIQDLSPELAESFGMSGQRGVVVAGVLTKGPAHQAGMQPGDVILSIAGKSVHNVTAALGIIAQNRPGNPVDIEVMREGNRLMLHAKAGERPVQPPA
ncbi:MAG: trypsin-like peptidase domain-containing protein [Gammaproteobacteria bacterium]|nr:trypsin-like peptidase domain-containing protein [Gammaproteobacteria bacterium]